MINLVLGCQKNLPTDYIRSRMIHVLTYFLKQSRNSWEEPECQSQANTSPKLYKARCLNAGVYFGE